MVEEKTKLDDPDKWGTAVDVFEQFRLTKGTLYKLVKAGRIKSVYIKSHPEARKGVRFFSIASIKELYAESLNENVRA
jgi:hypothetical protein